MSAQPVHEHEDPDPCDPEVILARLPERERPFFLQQYRERAHAAADDVAGYKALQRFLHLWSIKAVGLQRALADNPRYYEDLDEEIEGIRNGTIPTVPIEDVLAQALDLSLEDAAAYWQGKVEEARQNRR